MKTNYALRMAVLCLLGTASQGTMAVSWGTALTAAQEQATVSATDAILIGDVTGIPIITGKNILNTTFYYVKLTLTGGATFASDVDLSAGKLQCDYDGEGVPLAGAGFMAGAEVLVQVPGKGKTEVTYQLSSGALAAGATCKMPGLSVNLTSGQKEYSLQAFVNYNTVEGSTTATNIMSLITFGQAFSVKAETPTTNNGKVTVDVRSPSLGKGFLDGVPADYTATMPIGKVSYTNASSVKKLAVGAAAAAAPGDFIKEFAITVSGLPIAAGAEVAGQVRSGAVFLATTEACTTYLAGGLVSTNLDTTKVVTVSGGSATLNVGLANLGSLATTSPPVVCMRANGITSLPKGTVKFSVAAIPENGATTNTTVVNNELSTFVKNGASVKVLNIPSSTNATDAAFIRIYNMSDAEATVYGTLYNQGTTDAAGVDTGGGEIIGTENMVLGKIPGKGVIVVSPSPANTATVNLTALAGKTWEGKAWMQVESDVQQLRVQALIRTGGMGGVTVNAGERVKADGECVVRSDEECYTSQTAGP